MKACVVVQAELLAVGGDDAAYSDAGQIPNLQPRTFIHLTHRSVLSVYWFKGPFLLFF